MKKTEALLRENIRTDEAVALLKTSDLIALVSSLAADIVAAKNVLERGNLDMDEEDAQISIRCIKMVVDAYTQAAAEVDRRFPVPVDGDA